jgi:hypothetical protein
MITLCLLFCAVATAALAEDEATVEAQASVRPGEKGQLDRGSIGEYGESRRFDVSIVWDDTQGARPADHNSRVVRYVAQCQAGTLTLAAVGVFDRSGMLVKRMIVPPGAADPEMPQAGSQQAKWLRDVCM